VPSIQTQFAVFTSEIVFRDEPPTTLPIKISSDAESLEFVVSTPVGGSACALTETKNEEKSPTVREAARRRIGRRIQSNASDQSSGASRFPGPPRARQ
jgi:hypothetical protein